MKITKRQEELLKHIVDEYISTNKPVGSKIVVEKYMPDISSQTIRIEMGKLEELGLLQKTHTSSGRVPSIEGYKYYDKNLLIPIIDKQIKEKLNSIFCKRVNDIDVVIKDTLNIINEITGLPSLSLSEDIDEEKLSEIRLIKLDHPNLMLLIVSNTGNILKNIINFSSKSQVDDLITCMEIFNKQLVGVELNKILDKIKEIEPIIKEQVLEYEFITQEVIYRLFQFIKENSHHKQNQIVGINSVLNNPELQDPKKIQQIIKSIETGNIWKQIKYVNNSKNTKTQITYSLDQDMPISVATTSLVLCNKKHQISVLGPTSMNTSMIKGVLDYLNKQLEEIFKDEKEKD